MSSEMETPNGGEFISMFSMADYEAAIQKAPPGTLIMLGDLDKAFVTCTTCGGKMAPDQTQFHKHPKDCGICGETFDENMERHDPVHVDKDGGAGTVRFTGGCTKVSLA